LNSQPPRTYTRLAAAIVIAAVVIAGGIVATAYLGMSSAVTQTTTITKTKTSYLVNVPRMARTTSSTLGLEFTLSINSTVFQSGRAVNITASIFNIRASQNNVTDISDWALPVLQDFSTQPAQCPSYVSFQIFQGYYTESNISSAKSPLQLSPVGLAPACVNLAGAGYFLFQLSSNHASILVSKPPPTFTTLPMWTSRVIAGNFSTKCCANVSSITSIPVSPSSAPPFHPGTYTIVAGDEWGDVALLYFVVTATSTVQQST
jgi:hypothetical protein